MSKEDVDDAGRVLTEEAEGTRDQNSENGLDQDLYGLDHDIVGPYF